jgi:hypothetical protein
MFGVGDSCDALDAHGVEIASSYEAEQHLLRFGESDTCVCWALSGLVSGYLSGTLGEQIFALEDSCQGKADPICRLKGRFARGGRTTGTRTSSTSCRVTWNNAWRPR